MANLVFSRTDSRLNPTRGSALGLSLSLLAALALGCGDDSTTTTAGSETTGETDEATEGPTSNPTSAGPTTDGTGGSSSSGETGSTTDDPSTSSGSETTTEDPTSGTETDTATTGEPLVSTLMVGASWATLLPEVDGSTAYFDAIAEQPPLALEPGAPDADSPGAFVEEWDVGTIAIGNGAESSHWVHDEIRASAIAFQDMEDPDETIVVMATADVYMLFRDDIAVIHEKVQALLADDETYAKLRFIISATHNHMGPDTSGLDAINDEYYDYLADQIATAIVGAVQSRQLAIVRTTATDYQFGLADQNAPYLVDPTLHSLQAVSYENPDEVIATVVQWQNHPESVLGWSKNVFAAEAEAEYLKSVDECYTEDDENCYIEGQYISAGFSGYMARHIMEQTGAPALYFNGGVGAMMSPLRYPVWETEGPDGVDPGDGKEFPDGAVETGKGFHKLAVIGWELGKRVLADLEGGPDEFAAGPIAFTEQTFYTRLSNVQFRVGLSVIGEDPLQIGYRKRMLYTCPPMGPKDDDNCVPDDYVSELDPVLDLPKRVGDHAKTALVHAQIGPIELITAPGEVVTELTSGLPSDFVSDPDEVYYGSGELRDANLVNHLPPDVYETPGYARQALTNGDYRWVLGLTQDSGGYILAPSHYRIYCVGDVFFAPGTCQVLLDTDVIDYASYDGSTFAVSGARCKAITEDPSLLAMPPYSDIPGSDELVVASCQYGVAVGEFSSHYEETNSMGWDSGADWLNAVWAITGFEQEPEQINPDFVGANVANL